jgi:hypothetical protein
MERLRSHPDDLGALAALVAGHLGVPESFVEKDFWAIEVLRAASRGRTISLLDGSIANVHFLFKGGTSLSRAFGILQRFSEDVDLLAVFPDDSSAKARHRVLKQVDADVTEHLGIAGDLVRGSSDTGVKRYTRYNYPTPQHDTALTEGVLLELGSRGGTHPATTASIRSLLADVAVAQLDVPLKDWEELAPFDAMVLAPERTLLEKLCALHTAVASGDDDAAFSMGRHLYDVHCLLGDERVLDALRKLGQLGVTELAEDIHEHSIDAGFDSVRRPADGFATSPAFVERSADRSPLGRGYRTVSTLAYGAVPAFETVLDRIEECSDLL